MNFCTSFANIPANMIQNRVFFMRWNPPNHPEANRSPANEWMDRPGIPLDQHHQALRGLARLNRFSGAHGKVWRALQNSLKPGELPTEPIQLLDIATGGGDLPIHLFHQARQAGLDLRILAVDRSGGALDHALEACHRAGVPARLAEGYPTAPGIHLAVADALATPTNLPEADWVTSSLFLHHLTNDQAILLLGLLGKIAKRALVISDLDRSRLNLALVTLGSYLLSRSPMVRHDGPASVRAAFSWQEAERLAHSAGLAGATVSRSFRAMWVLRQVRA